LGLVCVFVLMAISLINLKSADYYSGDSFHRAQAVWMVLGAVAAFLVALVDIRTIERLSHVGYVFLTVLLIATALFGREVSGSTRWLAMGGMVIQPSEFMKVGLILALARHVFRTKGPDAYTLRDLVRPLAFIGLPFALIVTQPDLGTSIILLLVSASMLFYEGIRFRTVVMLIGVVGLVIPIAWKFDLIERYQKDRVVLWMMGDELDPGNAEEKRILDKNLQTEQALWAIGSGRVVGKGLEGGGRSRLKYLPEIHNDFILAIYAEEQGFLGCALLLALFHALIAWGLGVAHGSSDKFSTLVAAGVSFMFFWQLVVNVGMVTGLLPVVGSQLPFLSYGGSSLLTTFIGIGLLFNVATSRVKVV
jgi:rod shape determining protein RodA